MKRLGILAIGALMLASSAQAQTGEQGLYAGQLRAMFTAVADGSCPETLMGPELLGACRQQLPQMSAMLKAAGAIQSMTLVKAQDVDGRHYENYKVTFANGAPSHWTIGALQDGRFNAVYSLGD